MKLDPQKTVAASLATNIMVIGVWAAKYFWHVTIPPEVIAALGTILTGVLSHVQIFPINPTQAA